MGRPLGPTQTLIWVTLGIIVFGLLWVPLLGAGFWGVMLWLVVGFSLMGLTFGPMGALLPELFPTNVRYTGSGISYNVSSILGAAVAPFIAVALWQAGGGSPFWVGVYLSVMAVLTLIALLVSKETKDVDIEAAGDESEANSPRAKPRPRRCIRPIAGRMPRRRPAASALFVFVNVTRDPFSARTGPA